MSENDVADANILVNRDADFVTQESQVIDAVKEALKDEKLDAVICVAGGWAGGNASKDLAKNTDLMIKQSVWSSTISASVAAQFLKEGGVLTLTGAKPALTGTPGMIGYGMAKVLILFFLIIKNSYKFLFFIIIMTGTLIANSSRRRFISSRNLLPQPAPASPKIPSSCQSCQSPLIHQ